MARNWITGIYLISGMLAATSPVCANTDDAVAYALSAGWENRYVSEGRDNLDAGIFTMEGQAAWNGFAVGIWAGMESSGPYRELNLFVEYGLEAGPLDAYIGYSRLRFPADSTTDNELSIGISVNSTELIIPAIDYTYSEEAAGGFVEISIQSRIRLLEGQLVLEPYLREGIDLGYISKIDKGAKNLQFGIGWSYMVDGRISVSGSVNHSWTHADHPDFGDVSWVTLGLTIVR